MIAAAELLLMGIDGDPRLQWHLGGRHYLLWQLSGPDHDEVELEGVGPGPGRGFLRAARDDRSGEISVSVDLERPVPIEVFNRFVAEANAWLRTGNPQVAF